MEQEGGRIITIFSSHPRNVGDILVLQGRSNQGQFASGKVVGEFENDPRYGSAWRGGSSASRYYQVELLDEGGDLQT